jgi:hypothetical protein
MRKVVAVYVREQDLPLAERAERYARAHRMTLSGLYLLAIERFLAERDPEQPA